MKLQRVFRFAIFILLLVPTYSSGSERITIVTENWPPFNYVNADGEVVGIATNVVKQVMAHANLDYEFKVYAWSRAYKLAKENKNVLLYTVYRIEGREKDFQWICPLVDTQGVGMYTLASRTDVTINSLEDAKRYVTGIIGSGVTYDYLKFNGFVVGKHIDIGTDEYANIRKLKSRRIDLIVQEEDPFEARLKREGLNRKSVRRVFTLMPNDEKVACMAMSLDTSKQLLARIRHSLAIINAR